LRRRRQPLVNVARKVRGSAASRSTVNAGALVFAGSMVLSAAGFLFQAVATRRLGVAEYGIFYSLLSLFGLASLPVTIFAPVVTKYSAEFTALHDDAHVRGLIDLVMRAYLVVGLVYLVAGLALAVPLGGWLHVAPWEICIVGVMVGIGVLSGAMRAIGQGIQSFPSYAGSMAGEGIGKVAVLLVGVAAGLSIATAIGAFISGMLVGIALIAWPLLRTYMPIRSADIVLDWKRIFATTGGAAVLTLTMTAMGLADVIIVKHFFSADSAGLYSVASLSGRILFYFVGFVPTVLIPQATHRHARGERTRKLLWAATAFIAVVCVLGVGFFQLDGALVLHLLSGRAFDAALPLLPTYAGAMAALALGNALGSYGLSTHRLGFAIPLLVTMLGTIAVIAFIHPTLQAVASELLIGNLVMLAAVAVSLAIQSRPSATA
jgi:O-antigen/teichoic acid export membrane protein